MTLRKVLVKTSVQFNLVQYAGLPASLQYFAFLLIGLFCQAEAPFFLLSKNLHLCLKRKCTQSLNQQGRSSLKKELKKETLSQHQHEQSTRREQTDQIRESSRAGFLVDLPMTTHVLCNIRRAPGRHSGLRPGLRGVSFTLNRTFPGASCHNFIRADPPVAVVSYIWPFLGCSLVL